MAQVPESVLDATYACLRSFYECLKIPVLKDCEWAENRLADFNLWVDGVGASAKANFSLDNRLECEPGMRCVVIDLLNTLRVYVWQCKTIGESYHKEYNATSSNALLMEAKEGTEALLDQLANLAVVIRQAGTSSRLKKADRHFDRAKHEDLGSFLKVKLQARPKQPTSTTNKRPEDETPAPNRYWGIGAENFNVPDHPLRPAQDHFVWANLRRRNRFIYAQRQANNLSAVILKPTKDPEKVVTTSPDAEQVVIQKHAETSLETAPKVEQIKSNNETAGEDQSQVQASRASTLDPAYITVSIPSQQAMTQASHTALKITLPKLQKVEKGLKTFKCPCCCQALPLVFTERNHWTKHLAQDICPYTCPIPDGCPNPDNLYRNKKAWLNHINEEHKSVQYWKCIVCDEGGRFLTVQTFSAHLRTHPNISEGTLSTLLKVCAEEEPPDILCCPLCTWAEEQVGVVERDGLFDHIAEHVYDFSLLSLPWADKETGSRVPEELHSRIQDWLNDIEESWGMDGSAREISNDILDKAEARLKSVLSQHIQDRGSPDFESDHEWFSWLWASRERKGIIKERLIEEEFKWFSWLDLTSTEREMIAQNVIQTSLNVEDEGRYFNKNEYFFEGSGESGLLSDRANIETSIAKSDGTSAGLPSIHFGADENFGLATLHSPAQEQISLGHAIDIIAVHGLGEDSFSSWTDVSSGKLWLGDFLPLSNYGNRLRVMTFGYNAELFTGPLSSTVENLFAEELLEKIQDSRKSSEEQERPIIFVAHSVGGFVVKTALVYAHTRPSVYGDVSRCTKGILYFGTPQVSDNAVLLSYLEALEKTLPERGFMDEEYKQNRQDLSHALLKIDASFLDIADQFLMAMFHEMRKTNGTMILTQTTTHRARTAVGKHVELDADHFGICRFSTGADQNYLKVLEAIETMIGMIDDMANLAVRPVKLVRTRAQKLIIAIDFGTTLSSIAYVYTSDPNERRVVKSWPDTSQSTEFVPTTIRYSEFDPELTAPKWGYQLEEEDLKHEWFKLGLYPELGRTGLAEKYPGRTAFPPVYGKECEKMVTDYLKGLKRHAERYVADKLNGVFLKNKSYIVTVPAVWSDQAQATTRRCADNAGMGSKSTLQIITEPEAAGIYALENMKLGLNVHDTFVLCDAGGGAVDLISYTVSEVGERPLISESAPGSGSLCGSTFLNRIFDDFLRRKFANYPKWDKEYHQEAIHRFEIKIKREFNGDLKKSWYIPARGLTNNLLLNIQSGKVEITGKELAGIFEPVIKEILALVSAQIRATHRPVKAVLLAGGFGTSNYLKKRIEREVNDIKVVQIQDGDTAIVRGALIRGLVEMSPGLASVRIDGRVARIHYGALAGVPFDPKKHDVWRKEPDGLSGGDCVKEMKWFVKKGTLIRESERPSYGFYWCAEVYPGYSPAIELTLYKCEDSSNRGAPLYEDDRGVERLVKLTADVRSMLKDFQKEPGDDGKMYYKLDFDLEMEYQSGRLKFSIVYKGKKYDTATEEFE